jgi:SAM-dependent methyltransferase
MLNRDDELLVRVGENWELLAKSDPLWAILSAPEKKGNKWDIDEFLQTGEREINTLMDYLTETFSFKVRRKALDFGCGIGRLTLPLAHYFDHVVGIDISDTMISMAQDLLNRRDYNIKEKIEYVLNKSNTIPFEDNKFDLVYSSIVLQHMHKKIALSYISEFVRILEKKGFAVFHAPSRCLTSAGDRFETPIETPQGTVTIDMNLIPIDAVIDTVHGAGGKIVEIKNYQSVTKVFEGFKYYVSK